MTEASAPASQPQQNPPGTQGPDTPSEAHAHRHLRFTQAIVLLSLALCVLLAWWAGKAFDVPAYRGYEGSLLQQPGAGGKVLAVVVAAAVLAVGAIVGQLLAGRWWLFAGLFAAAAGWAALSARGGPSRYVYFHAADAGTGRGVFVMLAVEQLILSAVVGSIWYTLVRRAERITAAKEAAADEKVDPDLLSGKLTGARLQAVGLQAAIMAFAVMIFIQSDSKQGVMVGVLVASFIGTSLAEYWFKDEKAGPWYWAGPLLVGAVGYLLNQFTASGDLIAAGQLRGTFAALARPLPLDYVGMGTVGALLGYWIGADHPELAVGLLILQPGLAGRGLRNAVDAANRRAAAGGIADNGQASD